MAKPLEDARDPFALSRGLEQHARLRARLERSLQPLGLRRDARPPDLAGRRDLTDLAMHVSDIHPDPIHDRLLSRRAARSIILP